MARPYVLALVLVAALVTTTVVALALLGRAPSPDLRPPSARSAPRPSPASISMVSSMHSAPAMCAA